MIDRCIQFSLKNRLLILALSLLVMGAGYYSYTNLPVDAFPDVSPNLIQIFTVTEGLAPQEVEQYVTYPVESAMSGLPGLKEIRSVSNFGLSVVNVYFEDGMNIYLCRQVVSERLQEAREQIPEGFGDPQMGPISTGMGLILFYYLEDHSGKYSLQELRTIQDWVIKYHLQTVQGVTEVLGIGGWEKQFQVQIVPQALLSYDITLPEVIEKIKANNLNVGAQYLTKGSEEYVVRSVGLTYDIDDLENIVIKSVDGTPVFLKDLAVIETGGAIRRGLQVKNGVEEVVAGQVVKLFGANSSTVIKRVESKVEEINKILPEGVSIVPYYDQKALVEACVATVMNALIQGIGLVALVIVLFMGSLRPSLVVALSIPFSVLFSFLLMRYFGISANLMSLGGLAIAIGMMVDGAIVIVENADRMLREAEPSEPRIHVIARACREVGRPIIFAIVTIIVVFFPLFTLQGVEGKTFRPLAYTLSQAMAGSLIYAIFVSPVLIYYLMRRPTGTNKDGKNPGEIFLIRKLLRVYEPLVSYFVKRRKLSASISAGLLVIGAAIYTFLGSEFTPELQEGTMVVKMTLAPSISIEDCKKTALITQRTILELPEVEKVVSRIGRGEVGACIDPINTIESFVSFKPRSQWESAESQEDLENTMRAKLNKMPGVLVNFTQPIEMAVDELLEGVRAELAIKLFGDDLEVLKQKADEIAAVVTRVRGAADVQPDQISGTPQLRIQIDRQAIARYGINIADVQSVVRAAVGGETAGQIFEGIRRFDILVRYLPQYRQTAADVGQLLIKAPGGAMIPLSELAEIEEIVGPRQITRENNQRYITIQCNVNERDIVSFVNEAQQEIAGKVELPPGYLVTWGGQHKLQQEANQRLALVIPITLSIILLLLYSSFNSMKNTILILLNIPLALVGGVAALWVSGQNLSVPATVGFIALFGIALENGMVLVTYLNQLVKEGLGIDEASVRGACLRMRPVLMTSVTTALGLIPLLFSSGTGSEVQRPLATVVTGGLVTSTFLTLLVIPALYKWFAIDPQSETNNI